jgi:DNA-3-methyladenine glycosylase II
MKPQYAPPTFENLVRSIAYQQLNGKAAKTTFDRVLSAVGGALTPESVLAVTEEQLRACGLSRQKLSYIRDLAARTQAKEIEFERLPDMSDDDVIEHLTRVKGIGLWSAQMFLMFALRRPDVMPATDFGVQMAIKTHWRKRKLPKPDFIHKLARPWAPYRSLAAYYLWRSLDGKKD